MTFLSRQTPARPPALQLAPTPGTLVGVGVGVLVGVGVGVLVGVGVRVGAGVNVGVAKVGFAPAALTSSETDAYG